MNQLAFQLLYSNFPETKNQWVWDIFYFFFETSLESRLPHTGRGTRSLNLLGVQAKKSGKNRSCGEYTRRLNASPGKERMTLGGKMQVKKTALILVWAVLSAVSASTARANSVVPGLIEVDYDCKTEERVYCAKTVTVEVPVTFRLVTQVYPEPAYPISVSAKAAGKNAGDYKYVLSVRDASGRDITSLCTFIQKNPVSNKVALRILKSDRKVVITIDSKTVRQGDPSPKLTAKVSGIFPGDKSVSYKLVREPGKNPGKYSISATGVSAANYSGVSVHKGTLTITPAESKAVPERTLTFLAGGETVARLKLKEGETPTPPAPPEMPGLIFEEWDGLPETMPPEDLTVRAVYAPVARKIYWIAGGEVFLEQSLIPGEPIDAPQNPPVGEGMVFEGWDKPVPEKMPDNNLSFSAVACPVSALPAETSRPTAPFLWEAWLRGLAPGGLAAVNVLSTLLGAVSAFSACRKRRRFEFAGPVKTVIFCLPSIICAALLIAFARGPVRLADALTPVFMGACALQEFKSYRLHRRLSGA